MKLSNKAIKDLKKIYEKEFNKKINDKKAQLIGIKLLKLYSFLTENDTNKKWHSEI